MATRNKDFGSLCRKILSMKSRVHEKQLAEELGVTAKEEPKAAESLHQAV